MNPSKLKVKIYNRCEGQATSSRRFGREIAPNFSHESFQLYFRNNFFCLLVKEICNDFSDFYEQLRENKFTILILPFLLTERTNSSSLRRTKRSFRSGDSVPES